MIRRRRAGLLLGALAAACLSCGRSAVAGTSDSVEAPRTEILLNGMWETREDAGASSASWAPVRVPQALVSTRRRRAVSYRLRFTLPEKLRRDRRALLVFEKAGHHVRAALNGKVVGEHYGVRLPFSFDVTDALRKEGENELSVWAAPADAANARPGGVASADEAKPYDVFLVGQPVGWYPAGIFGDVALHLVPAVRVEDVFVRTSFRDETVGVTVEVANHGRATSNVTVRTQVVSLEGTPTRVRLRDQTITLPPEGRATIEGSSPFPDAIPWPDGGGGTPPLYVLRASLLADRRTIDLVTRRFAFREVWSKDRDLVLNGRRLRVAADIVTSITERERLAHLFNALRSVGLNLVSTHWDDGTRSFYDLADEAGMLVMPELYCAGPLQLTRPVVAGPAWVEDMGREYEAWVKLRRNHAAIALWSPYDMVPTSGIVPADLEGFDRRVRAADPTRPILGREVLATSIGDAHTFVADPRSLVRAAYEKELARARADGRPLMVGEIASLPQLAPDELRALLETLDRDAIVGFGGPLLESAMFESGTFALSWPSPSGSDARPVALDGAVQDVVNWSDPSRPSFTPTALGRLVSTITPQALGTTAAPLAFVRSPELLVVAPPACGGRGYALAAPLAGAGGVERATLLDPQGKGWLVLTEPGTYRVRLACDQDPAVTVEARGRPFSGRPGFDHLQEVRLDAGR